MRLSILRSFWRVHKGHRPILRCLEPFAERRRSQGYPASAWEDAAVLGFLTALITRLAQRRCGALDTDALASLQSMVWGQLTGLPSATLGERIMLLSAAADPRFLDGGRRAAIFEAALAAAAPDLLHGGGSDLALARADARDALFGLWDSLLADLPSAEAALACQEFPDGR